MTAPPLPALVRRALARHALADTADRDLLRRFAAARDPDAFTEPVERYAPLVPALRAPAPAATSAGAAAVFPFAKPLGLAAMVAAAVVGLVTLLPAGAPDTPPAKDAAKTETTPKAEEKAGGFPLPAGAVHRFGNRQLRHPEGVHTMVVSPDGKLLATVGGTNVVVWDLQTLQPKCVLRDQRLPGYTPDPGPGRVSFTADSKSLLVVTSPRDGVVRFGGRPGGNPAVDVATIFDLDTGKPRFTLKGEADHWMTAWESAAGKEFAVGNRQAVRFYDAKDGKELKKVDVPEQSSGLAWVAPRADRMAVFGRGGANGFTVCDTRAGKEVYSAATGDQTTTAAFTADGKRLAVYDLTGKVHLHDLEDKKELFAFDHPGGKQRGGPMRFSADGRTLFVGGQHGMIYRWDVAENRRLPNVGPHSTWTLSSIALSPDESVLYSTGYDKLVRRWDLKTGKQLPLPEGYITQTTVAPTPDGRHLLVADHGGALDLWELATGKRAKSLISSVGMHGMDCVAVSDDGRWLAGGRTVQDIRLYDLKAGRDERVIPLVEKPDTKGSDHVRRVEFAHGGKVLYSGSGQTGTTAWEVPTGKQLWRTAGGPLLTVDPRGRWLASGGGFNSEVIQWHLLNAATGEQVRVVDVAQEEPEGGAQQGFQPIYPPYLTDLRFTPDGSRLVTAHYDGTVRIWDPETGKQLARLKGTYRGQVGLACSADSKWVAVGRPDGKIVVWELATEKAVLTVGPHDSMVRDVAFTPDGRGLIGNADLAPILWELMPKDAHTADTPDALWTDLATGDAERAYRLQWGLIRDPKAAVRVFADKVKPAELAVPRADFDKWVGNLDSPQFRAREAAERELTRAGAKVPVEWLRKAMADAKSNEQRARLGRVLAARDKPNPEEWRLGRAVQVLERAGTEEAKALLKAWAAAPDGTQVAVEAKAALERLARRP